VGAVICLLVLAGCRGPLRHSLPEERVLESREYMLTTDIHVPQGNGPAGCGAQALGAAMGRLDPARDPKVECDKLPWEQRGATPVDVLLAARHEGFRAKVVKGDWALVSREPDASTMILVLFDSSVEVWSVLGYRHVPPVFHWSVVSGASKDGKSLLLAGMGSRHYLVGRELFEKRWAEADNCAILVQVPGHAVESAKTGPAQQ
jgi:ABC-type bacteriocin/lantibiotic exporter with double-glycine peptidase domain